MSDLFKNIEEVVKASLPQQVGEQLRKRLEETDKLEKELKDQKVLNKNQAESLNESNKLISELQKNAVKVSEIERREKEVSEKERNQEIEKLKYQLDCEKYISKHTMDVAMGLVRNTTYKKQILDSEFPGGAPVIDGHGNAHYPQPLNKNYSETNTEE